MIRVSDKMYIPLKEVSEETLLKIKQDLTVPNKDYENALRYSKYGRVNLPKYIYLYKCSKSDLIVPRGYGINKAKKYLDETLETRVDYPKPLIQLRELQSIAEKNYLRNTDNGLIILNTGIGKSILGLHIAYMLRQKTLVIVHKNDLIVGWQKDSKVIFGDKYKTGLIKAKKFEIGEQITLATIQTLNRLDKETLNTLYDTFGCIIVDECLVGSTLVVKADGGVEYIRNIKDKDKLMYGTALNSFHKKSVVYQLRTSHGIIEGSPNHPCWCVKKHEDGHYNYSTSDVEVKRLRDLDDSYLIPVPLHIPHTVKNEVNANMAQYCAMIICDGHLDRGKSNRVKVNVSKDIDWYKSVYDSSGLDYKHSLDCRHNHTFWVSDRLHKKYLEDVWKIPGGKKSTKIVVPEFLYYSPLGTIKAFIETCYNCEGDLDTRSKSYRINFTSCSLSFAQGLSLLLRKFGILAHLQIVTRKNKNHNTAYRLTLGGDMFNKFMDTFTLIPRKMTYKRNKGKSIHYKRLLNDDVYLTEVVSVTNTHKICNVYDFEVTGTHSFVANGLITHNCHHAGAKNYDIINNFKGTYRIGLTATLERADSLDKKIYAMFGGVAFKYKVKKSEDILPVNVLMKRTNLHHIPKCAYIGRQMKHISYKDYGKYKQLIPINKLEYNERPVLNHHDIDNFVVTNKDFIKQVMNDIKKEVSLGHKCIVAFNKKEHIDLYAECLKELGIECYKYYGDSKDKKDIMLQRAEEVPVTLATYSIATEGTNVKSWQSLFIVSSINSGKNTEQIVGRIRRTDGIKRVAFVYDYYHPNVYGISKHHETRMRRYSQLGLKIKMGR